MDPRSLIRVAFLASTSCGAILARGTLLAATPIEFVDPHPAAGNQFGVTVVPLSTGNVVVTSPFDDANGLDAGAVYLFNGSTGVLISALRGSASHTVGSGGVTALANGNFVIASPAWDNGGVVDAGAVTWCSGMTGLNGVVSTGNSVVGAAANDLVGNGGVIALSNGNYVVVSSGWNSGGTVDAGAVTWGSGVTGVSGLVSAVNSLVGTSANDLVGSGGVTALSNGHYVVRSPVWNNGAVFDAGAATWASGATGASGAVSAANSLVGTTVSDNVGSGGVTALSNGNYVVVSPLLNHNGVTDNGAATWGNGATGVSGTVTQGNSLVGSGTNDFVGNNGVTVLSNGNYVVRSPFWNNVAVTDAGAATWGSGTTGVSGLISAANSLVGVTLGDNVGSTSVTALSNGNYVVASAFWNDVGAADVGAVTWGSGTTGVSGVISAANSLIGSVANDLAGYGGVTVLSNGNYVVASTIWDNGGVPDAGAVTWGDGTTGVSGAVSAANSLVGSTAFDFVSDGAVKALTNGDYVVTSPGWDNGGFVNAGAATWGSGATGVSGVVASVNSLVGSRANDLVGNGGVTALTNGNYVVLSAGWDNGGFVDAGAVTWGSGTTGVSGPVTIGNSLVGLTANTSLQTIVEDAVNSTFVGRFLTEGGGRVRVGPVVTAPAIVSLVDIPSDQGGWVRLTFTRSDLDQSTGLPPVTTYGIWRHVPGTIPADAAAFPPGTWALITSVPAVQQSQYVADIPTISNAAPNDFVVSAHTTTPTIWFVSDPASGQSVDNLAPAAPTGLTAAYSGGETDLQWAANTENDLGSYRVYRGASADFTPGPENQIATVTSPGYSDVGPAGGYYKVSARDVNGNESGATLIGPDGTTDVEGEGAVAFALQGARPNPTLGRGLNVAFALPSGAAARLELLDVTGRRVLAREVGSLGRGRHTVNLAEGRRIASGIYWVTLTQGASGQTTRVAVIE